MSLFRSLKGKVFYGWVIVASCLIIAAVMLGVRHSFGVFFKPLVSEFELSRLATSSINSLLMVFSAVFAFVGGWALDKFGPKRVVLVMGVCIGLSLLLTSFTTSLWQLFIVYSFLLAIGTGAAVPVLMSLVSRWFNKKRGLALGISTSGIALGTIIAAPLAAFLIAAFSWRIAYIILGIIAAMIIIALSRPLIRNPGEIGALPDGAKPGAGLAVANAKGNSSRPNVLSLSQALKTRNFWFIFATWLFFAVPLNLMLTHFVPYATDAGISTMEAATLLSIVGGVSAASRAFNGLISDFIGRKIPAVISTLLQAVAMLWLVWSHEPWTFYVFAVLFGFCWGGFGVLSITVAVDTFGVLNLGAIMGALDIGFALGSAIGPALGGYAFDTTGSYTAAFIVSAILMVLTAILVVLVKKEVNNDNP